ncbi:MAG: hypothetical protein HYR72_25370 [Deltaproteobacteria bacterium]|nr:hypothetical protein [Deltaproteobacteria bacterium]MBI3388458.1 hypothetical protein [Deltaproteobacteria bacterium]
MLELLPSGSACSRIPVHKPPPERLVSIAKAGWHMGVRGLFGFAIVVAWCASMRPVFAACVNGHPSLEQEYRSSAVVFAGRVGSQEVTPEAGGYADGTTYSVSVEEVLRGAPGKTINLFSENSSGRFPMRAGTSYLIFVYEEQGRSMVNYCGNSGELTEKASALGSLRKIKARDAYAASSRQAILETFREYETLNEEFLISLENGKGKSGKPYSVLREEVEDYAEGPFDNALDAAQTQVCKQSDAEVLRALFRVILATSNSAEEKPAWILGEVFVCQPVLVQRQFKSLPTAKQSSLYGTLVEGFDSAVYGRPQSDEHVVDLRRKLRKLAPEGWQ